MSNSTSCFTALILLLCQVYCNEQLLQGQVCEHNHHNNIVHVSKPTVGVHLKCQSYISLQSPLDFITVY